MYYVQIQYVYINRFKMDILLESIRLGRVRTQPSIYVSDVEYNLDDLFTALNIHRSDAKNDIIAKMISNDYIGRKMDYLPNSCVYDLLRSI